MYKYHTKFLLLALYFSCNLANLFLNFSSSSFHCLSARLDHLRPFPSVLEALTWFIRASFTAIFLDHLIFFHILPQSISSLNCVVYWSLRALSDALLPFFSAFIAIQHLLIRYYLMLFEVVPQAPIFFSYNYFLISISHHQIDIAFVSFPLHSVG